MDIDTLRASVTKQGGIVRQLKQDGADNKDILDAVEKLKELKISLENAVALETMDTSNDKLKKKVLEDLLIRKMFVVPSFEIYGGVAGFYDFGPSGSAVKTNLIDCWRRHFLLKDSIYEIECTNLMPEVVLKTSGHVDKFTDLMVKDTKTGECYRADKLVEDHIENLIKTSPTMSESDQEKHRLVAVNAESLSVEDLHQVIKDYKIVSPSSGAELTPPLPFNLMFKCAIGPEGGLVGYLRPETAQGIFLNFRRLLDYNSGRLPFGCAQIGNAFRNEISPRGGLLRVREFQQAEIEYFVNPKDKSHPKFSQICDINLTLFPRHAQLSDGKTIVFTVAKAVQDGIIANQCLGYFLAKTHQFVAKIGIDMTKVRFRQHLLTEMAHYACDCWDLEVFIGGSWVECAGHADRSCYDLQVHSKKSNVEMVGTLKYDSPRIVEVATIKANKGKMGGVFKTDMANVSGLLDQLQGDLERALEVEAQLEKEGQILLGPDCNGKSYVITREMLSISKTSKKVNEEKFVPSVIEPSFGIGRILSAVFEHNFYVREGDEKRCVMAFSPCLAPVKVAILPLSSNASFDPFIEEIEEVMSNAHISSKIDNSSVAIGRKYARSDEIGIPFAITIDFETISTRTVTVRERDTCSQVRIPIDDLGSVLLNLSMEMWQWERMLCTYPNVRTEGSVAPTLATIVERTGRGNFSRPTVPIDLSVQQSQLPKCAVAASPSVPQAKQPSPEDIEEIKARIISKGDEIRELKSQGGDKAVIKSLVDELLQLKGEYKKASGEEYIAPNQGSSKKK